MNRISLIKFALPLTLAVSAQPSAAWDGIRYGLLGHISVTNAGNFGFRVDMAAGGVMCTDPGTSATANEAYLEPTDSNYQAYLSVILTAAATGKPVTLYTNYVGGLCRIGYVTWTV